MTKRRKLKKEGEKRGHMAEKKNAAKELKNKLFMQRKNGYFRLSDKEITACNKFAEKYKSFLDNAKTEREAVVEAVKTIEAAGFVEYKKGMKLKAGDKIYRNNRGKAVLMAGMGGYPARGERGLYD